MQRFCMKKAEDPIFNENRTLRVQYHFKPDELPSMLKQKVLLLEGFLLRSLQFCEPNDWVCLESKPGCLRQEQHCDFNYEDIASATEDGVFPAAFPYACMRVISSTAVHLTVDNLSL